MSSGVYYFFGGLLMIFGSVLEFILGNKFPFGCFGAFWLSYVATLTPAYDASIAYDLTHPYLSSLDPEFASTFAFFHLFMGVLCFIFLCSLRTSICFMLIFMSIMPAFGCLAATCWKIAEATPEAAAIALKCQHAGGGLVFAVCILGWYLFAVQLLASVDFPMNLPVGDLSRFMKGASEKNKTA
jgi:succinate-acetate transporter protein